MTRSTAALLAALGLSGSCAAAAPAGATRAWPEALRPVTVAIDASMPSECIEAAWRGVEWWADRGVDFLVPELAPSTHPAVLGVPRAGEIGVTASPLSPPAVGLTQWLTLDGRRMRDAHITLDPAAGCAWQVAAHELGHGLGLPDLYGRDAERNVMFGVALRLEKMDVTPEQLEQVR